jgi:hypothetical protein
MTKRTLAERIQKHTRRDGVAPPGLFGPCWVWTGALDKDGYGQVSVQGKTKQAHWASYENERGPVKDGLELDHKCENRPCVNPAHLQEVTHEENVRLIGERERARKREAVAASIDETEARIMRVLRIDPAKCEGFRLDDLRPQLDRMMRAYE